MAAVIITFVLVLISTVYWIEPSIIHFYHSSWTVLGFHVYFFSFQSALAVEHFFFTNTLELFNCSVLDAFVYAFHVELFMNASFLLNYAGVFLLCTFVEVLLAYLLFRKRLFMYVWIWSSLVIFHCYGQLKIQDFIICNLYYLIWLLHTLNYVN
jgi:hypothetical protein